MNNSLLVIDTASYEDFITSALLSFNKIENKFHIVDYHSRFGNNYEKFNNTETANKNAELFKEFRNLNLKSMLGS